MKNVLRKTGVGMVAVLATVALLAAPAGALSWSSGFEVYKADVLNGQIQCASRYLTMDLSSSAYDVFSKSNADKDIYCVNDFFLPAGWIQVSAVFQKKVGGNWALVDDSGLQVSNVTQHNWAARVFGSKAASGTWRSVSGHNVAILGGWQQSIRVSSAYTT